MSVSTILAMILIQRENLFFKDVAFRHKVESPVCLQQPDDLFDHFPVEFTQFDFDFEFTDRLEESMRSRARIFRGCMGEKRPRHQVDNPADNRHHP